VVKEEHLLTKWQCKFVQGEHLHKTYNTAIPVKAHMDNHLCKLLEVRNLRAKMLFPIYKVKNKSRKTQINSTSDNPLLKLAILFGYFSVTSKPINLVRN